MKKLLLLSLLCLYSVVKADGIYITPSSVSSISIDDTKFTLFTPADVTKKVQFQVDGINTGTTRIFKFNEPGADTYLVDLLSTQTLQNKTEVLPVILMKDNDLTIRNHNVASSDVTFDATLLSSANTHVVLTIPATSMTLAGTNNKLSAFAATTSAELANVISDETGSGALVFQNTPTFIAPVLGVATSTSIAAGTTPATTGAIRCPGNDASCLRVRNAANNGNLDILFADPTDSAVINIPLKLPQLASSSAATTGTVCWTTGTGLLNVDTTTTCLLSSRKYKENILDLNIGLAEVLKLHPISFTYKKEYNSTGLGEQVGLIAEEVQKIDPRLVSTEKDGSAHAIRYQQMIAVLVKAIQEQQVQINKLTLK